MLRAVLDTTNFASAVAIAVASLASESSMRLGYRIRLVDSIVDAIFIEED